MEMIPWPVHLRFKQVFAASTTCRRGAPEKRYSRRLGKARFPCGLTHGACRDGWP